MSVWRYINSIIIIISISDQFWAPCFIL